MGKYSIVLETGSRASDVDHAARAALDQALSHIAKDIWRRFGKEWSEEDQEGHHNSYDRIYNLYSQQQNRDDIIVKVTTAASRALTGVVQNALRNRFPGNTVLLDGEMHPIDYIGCLITRNDSEEGERKDALGYFSPFKQWSYLRVYVEPDKVFYSLMAMIQMVGFGEAENEDDLTQYIAPIFVHEFIHACQYLKAGSYMNAFGRGHVGKKGARATPRKSEADRVRYYSSYAELDSFATETASELYAGISRHRHSGMSDESIDYILKSMAEGYVSSPSFTQIYNFYQACLSGHYDEYGVTPEKAHRIWRHFLKMVVARLNEYRTNPPGVDMSTYVAGRADPQWFEWAKQGFAKATALIAHQIAFSAELENSYDWQSKGFIDKLSHEDNEKVWKASSFLYSYFFKENWDKKIDDKIRYKLTDMVMRLIRARK